MDTIQPGGGIVMGWELAWGRFRRAWLRRFRAGYVRRMVAARQGRCDGCPHDIIDPRDLKYFRVACGYWFHERDDSFRWRGRIGLARAGLAEVVCSTVASLGAISLLALAAALTRSWIPCTAVPFVLIAWAQLIWFFRDPDRVAPDDPSALLSPADGVVTHLEEVDAPDFGRAFRISIYLSPWNVHVNRIPRSGRVESTRYVPGVFHTARHRDCAKENEQLWTDLRDSGDRLVRIKQISAFGVRRTVCWLKAGEEVRAGDRYGMIKYGSRTDVLVPLGETLDVQVRVGDRVRAGSTTLLRFRGK